MESTILLIDIPDLIKKYLPLSTVKENWLILTLLGFILWRSSSPTPPKDACQLLYIYVRLSAFVPQFLSSACTALLNTPFDTSIKYASTISISNKSLFMSSHMRERHWRWFFSIGSQALKHRSWISHFFRKDQNLAKTRIIAVLNIKMPDCCFSCFIEVDWILFPVFKKISLMVLIVTDDPAIIWVIGWSWIP